PAQGELRASDDPQTLRRPRKASGLVREQSEITALADRSRAIDGLAELAGDDAEDRLVRGPETWQQLVDRTVDARGAQRRVERGGERLHRQLGMRGVVGQIAIGLEIEGIPGDIRPKKKRRARPETMTDAELVEDVGIVNR